MPSPSLEKKVYFRVEKYPERCPDHRRGLYEWYAIDKNHHYPEEEEEEEEEAEQVERTPDEKDLETLDPVFESPSDSSYFMCGMASWKSYIYIMGGCKWLPGCEHTPVSDVFYIDTSHPEHGWQPGPALENHRRGTYGVLLNGKICVLGGFPMAFVCAYGESLQPLSSGQNWLSMGIYPEGAPVAISGHALFSGKLFAYGFSGTLQCYDFEDKKWSVIEEDFSRWEFQCASIDGIMYLVAGGKFMGFDLVKYQWYEVVGLEENSMLPHFCNGLKFWGLNSTMVHIGNGTLCLLWNCSLSLQYTAIHCTKFTVCKEYDDAQGCFIIKANVKSYKVYRINGGFLTDALVVDAGEESTDHDEEEDKEEEVPANDERKLPKKKNKKKKKRS